MDDDGQLEDADDYPFELGHHEKVVRVGLDRAERVFVARLGRVGRFTRARVERVAALAREESDHAWKVCPGRATNGWRNGDDVAHGRTA